MLKKIFNKMLNNKSKNESFHNNTSNSSLIRRVSCMDLRNMKHYIHEGGVEVLGMEEILKRLSKKPENTKRRFIEINDSNSKIIKCFDLVINIVEHEKSTKNIIVLAQQFIYYYSDLISQFDELNQKYYYKDLNNAIFFTSKKLTKSIF